MKLALVGPARIVVVIVVVFLGVGEVDLELGQEVLGLVGRDVDRGDQPVVADVDEAVVALELDGDRLAERIVVVLVLDPTADASGRARRTPRAPTRIR